MNGQDTRIGPDYSAGGARAPITAGGRVPAMAGRTYKTRLSGPPGANWMERRNAACAPVHKTITPAAGVPTRAALYPDLQIAADHMLPIRHAILPAPARNHPAAHQG